MALIVAFTVDQKKAHTSQKLPFNLISTNYVYWKALIHPFLLAHLLLDYVDGTISYAPIELLAAATTTADPKPGPQPNPNYLIWIANDVHVHLLIISSIPESIFCYV